MVIFKMAGFFPGRLVMHKLWDYQSNYVIYIALIKIYTEKISTLPMVMSSFTCIYTIMCNPQYSTVSQSSQQIKVITSIGKITVAQLASDWHRDIATFCNLGPSFLWPTTPAAKYSLHRIGLSHLYHLMVLPAHPNLDEFSFSQWTATLIRWMWCIDDPWPCLYSLLVALSSL